MSLTGERLTEIAVLGAHCDDIAIGAGGTCGFIVGAMALGLAAARFISDRKWMVER